MFPTLKLRERREVRISIIKRDNKSQEYPVARRMVKKAAALRVTVQRPACRMYDQALFMPRRFDLPDFLDANAVMLRITVPAQVETPHQLLTQTAAHTFGENRVFAAQFITGLVAGLLLALFIDAHIAGRDACDPPCRVV